MKTILWLCATRYWIYINSRKTQHLNYYKLWYLFLYLGILHSQSIILLGLCLVFAIFVHPFSSVVLKWNILLIWKIILYILVTICVWLKVKPLKRVHTFLTKTSYSTKNYIHMAKSSRIKRLERVIYIYF